MVYYEAAILKEIERHFFAIQNQTEVPDYTIQMPARTLVHRVHTSFVLRDGWGVHFVIPAVLLGRNPAFCACCPVHKHWIPAKSLPE